ncbi:MAG: hypothetical protein KDE67_00295 [Sphingobium sp.]|nr:hypothetical protein [Sphingobium sp.]MCP5397694.1 hypothetical protein [Sphingomonas sp.]
MKGLWTYVQNRWERMLFGCVGAVCLGFTFVFLWSGQITSASAVFAMSFFSFFYSNLARFKKFKGLGFEAELWEDKQKEAANLIDRLKSVVTVYTREIVMNNVMRGRWGGTESWQKRWDLLHELEGRHSELGQQIDFSDLKHEVESVFIFDLCSPLASGVRQSIESAKADAIKSLSARFGNPVTDLDGWNKSHETLRSIISAEDNLFERSRSENIARNILILARTAKEKLKGNFSIELKIKDGLMQRLEALENLIDHRPITITNQLIQWAEDRDAFSR